MAAAAMFDIVRLDRIEGLGRLRFGADAGSKRQERRRRYKQGTRRGQGMRPAETSLARSAAIRDGLTLPSARTLATSAAVNSLVFCVPVALNALSMDAI